jgi:hypothetical protein
MLDARNASAETYKKTFWKFTILSPRKRVFLVTFFSRNLCCEKKKSTSLPHLKIIEKNEQSKKEFFPKEIFFFSWRRGEERRVAFFPLHKSIFVSFIQ